MTAYTTHNAYGLLDIKSARAWGLIRAIEAGTLNVVEKEHVITYDAGRVALPMGESRLAIFTVDLSGPRPQIDLRRLNPVPGEPDWFAEAPVKRLIGELLKALTG